MLVVGILAGTMLAGAVLWLVWINRVPRVTAVSEAWLEASRYDRRQERND